MINKTQCYSDLVTLYSNMCVMKERRIAKASELGCACIWEITNNTNILLERERAREREREREREGERER